MSSKEKKEKENNVGTVTGEQDETSEKVGHRQSVSRKEKQKREAIYVIECTGKTINEGQLRQLIKQDGGLRKLEIRKSAEGREGNVRIAYFETKDQAVKTVEILNESKRYVSKQYKINDENGSREQKQQSGTLSNQRKEEEKWREHQREQAEAEKNSKSGANDGKNCHACDSSEHLIRTCTKQRNIFVTYKGRREITERDMINIMEEYRTIKRLKVCNKIHANNGKALNQRRNQGRSTKSNSRHKSTFWMKGFTLL